MLIQLSKTNVPRNLRGPVLIDSFGFLRYWATVWSTVAAAGLAESTHLKKLRHIESLYCHSDQLLGQSALDDALGNLDEHALSNILESWFVSIRNRVILHRILTRNLHRILTLMNFYNGAAGRLFDFPFLMSRVELFLKR